MCGIFGAYTAPGKGLTEAELVSMRDAIQHRGPDASGIVTQGRVSLGNVRLSIIDLSDASNQPVYGADNQVTLVQNGEIYNYIELRDEMQRAGIKFRTTGDTEVLLNAYLHWGPEFVTRLNGMFVIAIHDQRSETLHLYRDRLGVKPLYIAETPRGLLFASEIKALLAAGVDATANVNAFAQYFALNYIPPPETAFDGIMHLMPGHRAEISSEGVKLIRYWTLDDIAPEPKMSEQDAMAELRELLDDATRVRLRADAAFGAFLSGGLDSTSVVAAMRDHMEGEIRTYSIGFDDPRFDETSFAKMASDMFGTKHVVHISEPEITHLWPRYIYHCDQPHADVSFMPMDQVSRIASRDVKMVLTGDGGDELFAGYEKYLGIFPEGRTDHLSGDWQAVYARQSGLLQGDQPNMLQGALSDAFHDNDPYQRLISAMQAAPQQDPINAVLMGDTNVLLPGNNLVKPDRMAMANSLEIRAPFLDYRMAEFAFRVPGAMKLAGGETKAIYKAAMLPVLGQELTYRRKQMFTVPIGEWFKGALAGYCRKMLLDGRLGARGLFDMDYVAQMVDAHIDGRENFTRQVRALISLEIWFRLFIDRDAEMRDIAIK